VADRSPDRCKAAGVRALSGRGAFRRFKNELYEEYPDPVSVWQASVTSAFDVEQSDGSSTGLMPNAAAESFTVGDPIPSYPESTAVGQVPQLPPRAQNSPTPTCVAPPMG